MIPSGRTKNDSPGDRVGGRQSRGEGGEAVTGVIGGIGSHGPRGERQSPG